MIAYQNLFNQIFSVLTSEQRKSSWNNCRLHLEDHLSENRTSNIFFPSLLETDFGEEDILMYIDSKNLLSQDSNEFVETVNIIGKTYNLSSQYSQDFKPDTTDETAAYLADWLEPLGYKLIRWDIEDADFYGFIIDARCIPNLISLASQANVELSIQELSGRELDYDYQRPALFQDSAFLSKHDAESLILSHKAFFYVIGEYIAQEKKDLIWSEIEAELKRGYIDEGGYSAFTFEAAIEHAFYEEQQKIYISTENNWKYFIYEIEAIAAYFNFSEGLDQQNRFSPDNNIKGLSNWLNKQGYNLIQWHHTQFIKPEEEEFDAFIVKKENSQKLLSLGQEARIWLEKC